MSDVEVELFDPKEAQRLLYKGCLMLFLDADTQEKIRDWTEAHIPEEEIVEEEEEPHVTVVYGVSIYRGIEELIEKDQEPISLRFGPISRFKADDNRPESDVLILPVLSVDLEQLNSDIQNKVRVVSTYKDYTPHLTLAYVTPGSLEDLDGTYLMDPSDTVFADHLVFSRSSDDDEREELTLGDS